MGSNAKVECQDGGRFIREEAYVTMTAYMQQVADYSKVLLSDDMYCSFGSTGFGKLIYIHHA